MTNHISVVGVILDEVLMLSLCGVEGGQFLKPRRDRLVEDLGILKRSDKCFRCSDLAVIGVEDRRAVLRTDIRALAVYLGRIMSYNEEDI